MPRPKAPSPFVLDRFPLTVVDQRRLALSLGREELPPECTARTGEALAMHLQADRALRTQATKTTPGSVAAAIVKACRALDPFTSVDSGVDADTYLSLKPLADAFLAAADRRLAELRAMSRVYPLKRPLYPTCFLLRRIFEHYAVPDFMSERKHLRQFAFDALTAIGAELGDIDETHLYRLDEFLYASSEPSG
jgi:hypothetical protein